MQARDVMVSPAITVCESETVRDVAKLLIAKRIGAVPVVDHPGTVVGIVTESDPPARGGRRRATLFMMAAPAFGR